MGTTIYCLMLVYLAIADGGFDGDDDVRELLWVKDLLNVGDDLGDGDVLDNRDDDDRDLLGDMVSLSTEVAIMSYLRTWIALMTIRLTVMLTIVDY